MTLPPAEIGPGEFYPVVGVGPHPKPWPTGDHFDPELLENGDRRNVLDKLRIGNMISTSVLSCEQPMLSMFQACI
jgi:hypothetical protein